MIDYRPLHGRALEDLDAAVAAVRPTDFARPTPCADWDLGQLLAHLVGQHLGMAAAVRGASTREQFAPRPVEGEDWRALIWAPSIVELRDAFAGAELDRLVLLPEVHPTHRFRAADVFAFHFVDTVAHTWDVATALDLEYQPSDDLVAAFLDEARRVPEGDARTSPGAAFGPVIEAVGNPWAEALGRLGRDVVSAARPRGRVGA